MACLCPIQVPRRQGQGGCAQRDGGIPHPWALQSLLLLPVQAGLQLKGTSLKSLQDKLKGVKYIILDELSMVRQAQLAWMERRLRQATAIDQPFKGMSIIMTCDPGQLPPVGGTPRHHPNPASALNIEGLAAYRLFTDVFILDACSAKPPAGEKNVHQQGYIALLPRARNRQLQHDDWNILLTRTPDRSNAAEVEELKDASRPYYFKSEVNDNNGVKLRAIGTAVARCSAKHNKTSARKAAAEAESGLERHLF